METVIISISASSTVIALVVGGIKVLQFISDRPKRDEVEKMIDGKLEAMNVKIDSVAKDVKRIADALDKKTKR